MRWRHVEDVSLSTHLIQLRPLEPPDYSELYRMAQAGTLQSLDSWEAPGLSLEEYSARLWNNVHSQYLIIDKASHGKILALVGSRSVDQSNGHCQLVLALPEFEQSTSSLVMEGVKLFVEVLFRLMPLRKVYVTVPGFMDESMATILEECGFHVEGTLSGHRFVEGRYWDDKIWAMARI
jgi:RimJ/RimL family protein N-acetyltransferase